MDGMRTRIRRKRCLSLITVVCSLKQINVLTWWRMAEYMWYTEELSDVTDRKLVVSRPVSVEGLRSDVVPGEVVVGWSVSVEGLPSDVGWWMSAVTTVDDDRDQTEYPKLNFIISFGTEARNFLQWFSVRHRGDSPFHRRCWKFRTASLAIFACIKTSTYTIFFDLNFRLD